MKKQQIKRMLHAKHHPKPTHKRNYAQYRQRVENQMRSHTYENMHVILAPGLTPEEVQHARQMQAKYLTRRQPGPSSSRMILAQHEDDCLVIFALVSDIILDGKLPRILLEDPIMTSYTERHGKGLDHEAQQHIDSHIWLPLRDIGGLGSQKSVTVSIGDVVKLYTEVKAYRGKGDYGMRTTKFGLTHAQIWASGMPMETGKSGHGDILIRSDYPRHGDWVLSITTEGDQLRIKAKASRYPSYADRMKLNEKGTINEKE